MANLAQAVNVLQAVLLTEGAGLIKTPTYHVFDLFKGHQGGMLVQSECGDLRAGTDGEIPMLSHSASVKDGVLTFTAANCSLEDAAELCISVDGFAVSGASAQVLYADSCRAHNSFDAPETVQLRPLPVTVDGSLLRLTVPPCAVFCVTAEP
jgi:alpha-N-arabinofuranosidase